MRALARFASVAGGIIMCSVPSIDGAFAQGYPAKPVRILVGQGAGGGADSTARTVAVKLSESLGQPVVVENRTGAGGSIAIERVASSPADGYTLLLMNAGGTIHSALRKDLPYDLERDLVPVSLIADSNFVLLVHPSVPVKNVKALIALAKSRPGNFTYASAGIGSSSHLATELLAHMAGLKLVHVPYKGGAAAATANASGEVDMGFSSVTAALPLLSAGKVRPLAVSSRQRSAMLRDLPTLHEAGLAGYDRSSWFGILAPAQVPQQIVTRLNKSIVQVVAQKDVRDLLLKQALEPRTSTPQEFAAVIRRELAQNAKLVAATGAKPQ
ncbi:MAG TPA: tripartite tricarboxylate transporter substrate binding protein [Burkholderiales bacterium]|nr:tripartite tricarboxylate transporter substrate binding protein [Burkholderiales bacterium]